jgi:CHASE2 domain-containing sensor protein
MWWATSGTLTEMADLQKRGAYTPRRAREQRAYRLVVGGAVAGGIGIVTLVLAVAGIVSGAIPAIALIVAALCAWGFIRAVGSR